MEKLTISDIARQAGVAKSTVSRYFNGGSVKEETRAIIARVIADTGFEPSAAAQNLKLKSTKTVGIVAPSMMSTVTGRQLTAMDETLRKAGYSVIILTTNHDAAREIEAIEYLRSLRVDGVILIATTITEAHEKLQDSSRVPFLVLGQDFRHGTSVIYDDYGAGYEVGRYARRMGHENVVYLGVSESDAAVGVQRKKGVLDGLASPAARIALVEATWSYEETGKIARKMLMTSRPTLVIAATDRMAMAVIREARALGLSIPEDLSIMGFGGYEYSELVEPRLATVRFENEEAGIIAARTLLQMCRQEPAARKQVLGWKFEPGGSVKDLREESREDR